MNTIAFASTHKKRPENSKGAAWLRGGQTVSHSLDMIMELTRKVAVFYILLGFVIWALSDHLAPAGDQLYACMHFVAAFYTASNMHSMHEIQVKDQAGNPYTVQAQDYDHIPFIAQHEAAYFHYMWLGLWLYVLILVAITAALSIWFIRHGFEKLESSEIRGQEIVELDTLIMQIMDYNASRVRLVNADTLTKLGLPKSSLKTDRLINLYLSTKKWTIEFVDGIAALFKPHEMALDVSDLDGQPSKIKAAFEELKNDTDKCHVIMEDYRWTYDLLYGFEKRPLWIVRQTAVTLNLPFYVSPKDYNVPRIAGVTYPIGAENEHTLICGGTGSGKSVAIHDIIDSIKECGNKGVVYDPDGEFIRLHFREGKDRIFNPFDARSVGWSPYNDLKDKTDWQTAAADLFPAPKTGDPYWTEATRNIYATAGDMLGAKFDFLHQRKPTIKEFIDVLIGEHEELFESLYKTSAANALGPTSGARADSLRSVLNTGIDMFGHLIGTTEDFSFRAWVNDPNEHGILFISAPEVLAESIRPILAHVATLMMTALLSRDPVQSKQKTWIILDEFASLGKIDSLRRAPERLRKYGGCMVLGMQQVSQLDSIYGQDDARTIIGQMRNKLILACNDDATGERMSNMLGKREVRRIEETTSYGANNIRDGVGLAPKDAVEPVAMPEQIMRLPTRTGYLMFSPAQRGRAFPITLVTYNYKDRAEAAEKFIPHNRPNPIKEAYKAELKMRYLTEAPQTVGITQVQVKSLPTAVTATSELEALEEAETDDVDVDRAGTDIQKRMTITSNSGEQHELDKEALAPDIPGFAVGATLASRSAPHNHMVRHEGSVSSMTKGDVRDIEESQPEAPTGLHDVAQSLGTILSGGRDFDMDI